MKKALLSLALGLGLSAATLNPQHVDTKDIKPKPIKMGRNSVVVKNNGKFPYPKLDKYEVNDINELVKLLDAEKKAKEEAMKRAFQEYERQRKLIEERERKEREERARKEREAKLRQLNEMKQQQRTKVQPQQHESHNNVLYIKFTHYTANCKGCIGKTRWVEYDVSNTVYYQGMRIVSTDPNVIPPYSIIEFELYGKPVKAIALDTGSAIKGNRIDLLVATKEEAMKLGVVTKPVKILRYGKGN